jgi:hypothetical protein
MTERRKAEVLGIVGAAMIGSGLTFCAIAQAMIWWPR